MKSLSSELSDLPVQDNPLLRLSSYDYPLPENLIARYPLEKRDHSRMLVLDRKTGERQHHHFYELLDYLNPGDLIIVNNTQVLPARLLGHRQGYTGKIEVLLLNPDTPQADPDNPTRWLALTRPTRRLQIGTIIELPNTTSTIEIVQMGEGVRTGVQIHLRDHPSVASLMEAVGHMPIPPYLKRDAEASDKVRYQTVFAKTPGAQAAPTAGLHFTPDILSKLAEKEIGYAEVTLAVSTGTFRHVDCDDITRHVMDPEYYTLPEETVEKIKATRQAGGKVIAVGTTVAKTLETVAHRHQGKLVAESAWSQLFIYPGFQFQVVDHLLTNFHLPKTTLMMLVSAFAERTLIIDAYNDAILNQYRFFSYGDCMLVL